LFFGEGAERLGSWERCRVGGGKPTGGDRGSAACRGGEKLGGNENGGQKDVEALI